MNSIRRKSNNKIHNYKKTDKICTNNKLYNTIKRIFDIVISSITLVILFPVFLILAVLIKLDSKGPIFFKHKRLGKDGKTIMIYKFRTMVTNAEESKRLANNSNSQPIIIITQLDGREIARTIVEPMSQELQKFDKKQSYNVGGTY